jgi:hypothetical protein
VKAQKLIIQKSPIYRSDFALIVVCVVFCFERKNQARRKTIGLDFVDANSTWARKRRDAIPPGCGIKPAKGENPMSAAG